MGGLAEMEEIADSIVFLASPLSSFMCGTGLVVDGYVFPSRFVQALTNS